MSELHREGVLLGITVLLATLDFGRRLGDRSLPSEGMAAPMTDKEIIAQQKERIDKLETLLAEDVNQWRPAGHRG